MDAMIKLTVGLLMFMGANVVLGSVNSMFDGTFEFRKVLVGIGKALVVIGVYAGVYYAGSLNPDVLVMEVNGVEANITTALYLVGVSLYIAYGKQLVDKAMVLLAPKNKEQ